MSLAEIEAELGNLTPDELRQLALKSWKTFVQMETTGAHECAEDDPQALAALDEAIAQANAKPHQGSSATEVRSRLSKWT